MDATSKDRTRSNHCQLVMSINFMNQLFRR